MISPTSSPAVANLALAAVGTAAAGVGAAARAAAAPKTRGAAIPAGLAATARQATGASAPGGLVPATRARSAAAVTRRPAVPGYAAALPTATNADVAFLRDPKLSLEDKLMRLLAHLNRKAEAEIQKKMEEVTGTSTQGSAKRKKSAFGQFADLAGKALGPAVGAALRAPGVGTALAKLGAPVVAAAAAALGAPALSPVLLKVAPALISGLAGAASSGASPLAGAASGNALSDKEKEFKLMEIQRLQNHQNEMFRLVSGLLRANHETRLGVIGNIR
jgi:hypothetical protein